MTDYPVRLARSKQSIAFADLPQGGLDLYIVEHKEAGELGIGTPDELRGLIDDEILPAASELRFRLEALAA